MSNKQNTENSATVANDHSTQIDHLKLWIDDSWYIPVNEVGLCMGDCSEGALGFVIQLESNKKDHYAALKIPRLLAETHRENAYICQLMEQEQATVQKIFRAGGNTRGLLGVHRDDSIFRGPIQITKFREAKEWDGAFIFVKFNKSQNPYFCLAKIDEAGNFRKLPEEADLPDIDAKAFEQLMDTARDEQFDWAKSLFLELPDKNNPNSHGKFAVFNVDEALQMGQMGQTWYTCLPSVTYYWAPRTLQEIISLNDRGQSWHLDKHLQLVENICNGLEVLHQKGFLHADVRPANIVCTDDPEEPKDYLLTDYGSLATGDPKAGTRNGGITGKTVIGPVIEGERASVFYAPERRSGKEEETADTAIIVYGDSIVHIILGWKSKLREHELLDENGKPFQETQRYTQFIENNSETPEKASSEFLYKGDRIQIRDYIFELEEPERLGENFRAFACSPHYWIVYHSRIVVAKGEDEHFESRCHSLSIPRVIELLQWSASTDLYSLGVLALYSVFWYPTDLSALNDTERKIMEPTEDRFRDMLTYLANNSHFKAIWPRLEWVRYQIETKLNEVKDIPQADLAASTFEAYLDEGKRSWFREETKTLGAAAIEVAAQINQSVPGIGRLLAVRNYQLGEFIFFMHFVLRCLHREDDLEIKENWKEWISAPFCKDRRELPTREEGGAIIQARKRLIEIRRLINIPGLRGLECSKENVGSFDLRSDAEIRQENARLRTDKESLNQEIEKLEENLSQEIEKLEDAEEVYKKAEQGRSEMEQKLNDIRMPINQALELMDGSLIKYLNVLGPFGTIKRNFVEAHKIVNAASPNQIELESELVDDKDNSSEQSSSTVF